MKKLLLFVTMAASLLFTQCKKEESVSSAGKTVSMTVTAGPGSKTDITENGAITWSTSDKLYVGDGSKYIGYLTIASGVGTPTGTFTGNVTLPTDTKDGEKSFGFFYLGSKNYTEGDDALQDGTSTQATVSFASQNIYNNNGKLENVSACHVGYGSAKGTVINDVVTDINVMLVSKVALAHFSFKKGDAAYTDGLTLKGDNIYNEMTVNFDGTFTGKDGSTTDGISLGNGHGERYVMLVPTGDATAQSLKFTGDNVAGTGEVPGLQANQFYGKDTPIAVTLTPTTIPVTGVSLSANALSLEAGKTETLVATVAPDDATDKSVTWSSTATGVATVSDAGVVTAVAAGTATITVTTVDGGKTATCDVTVTAPKPVFSVGENTTVEFAPGNLYWDGSAFRFEANQWSSASTWDASHVSHFFWSKDAAKAYAKVYDGTGAAVTDVFFTNATETTANSTFQVDGEEAGTWRILSSAEWGYLLTNRSGNRFAKAKVNGVTGLLIFPDGYSGTTSGNGIAAVNIANAAYPGNNIPDDTWASMESDGAVFLPAAGYRSGTSMYLVGSYGYYWSSTPNGSGNAYQMHFYSGSIVSARSDYRYDGNAVRLVRDAE